MVSEGFEIAILRRTESNGERNVWCKTDGEKEDRGPDGDVGIEGNSGSDGKGKWSEMVRALEFKVKGKRKQGQPKKTWKRQVEKEGKSVGLEEKDAMNQARWRVGVRKISDKCPVNPATPVYGDKPGSKLD